MPFELHPWTWTNAAPFLGYQGMNPMDDEVQCVFLGKDANFPSDAELMGANDRSRVLLSLYLTSPQAFFHDNPGVHHPFRHPDWNIPGHDGGRFHEKLERLLQIVAGPNQQIQASTISILEILRLPTIGNSGRCSLFKQAVAGQTPAGNCQAIHLGVINNVLCTAAKRVFVFEGFGGLWRSFSNEQKCRIRQGAPALADLGDWSALPRAVGAPIPGTIRAAVFVHAHFSNAITNAEIQRIAEIVRG